MRTPAIADKINNMIKGIPTGGKMIKVARLAIVMIILIFVSSFFWGLGQDALF
jgi:hypothetical protein